ncbi:HEPN domain-containing protein [Microbacterium sp. JZ70]
MDLSAAVRLKLDKADEFLLMAELALETDSFDAAVSLAVSASINASDALIMRTGGAIPRGPAHDTAVTTLRRLVDRHASQQLARALNFKNKSQYDLKRCTRADAEEVLRAAERLISKGKGLS